MFSISYKIAYPIIIAGLFIIVAIIGINYENLNASFYILFAFLIVYIFLYGFATGQNLTRPVRKLLQRADDLSRGDLKSRIYLKNKDEFGELAKLFNKIAEDLEQSKYENETAEKSVDIKVKARTQALEETISALEQKVKNRTLEIERISENLEKLQKQIGPSGIFSAHPKKMKKAPNELIAQEEKNTEADDSDRKSVV